MWATDLEANLSRINTYDLRNLETGPVNSIMVEVGDPRQMTYSWKNDALLIPTGQTDHEKPQIF